MFRNGKGRFRLFLMKKLPGIDPSILSVATLEYPFRETVFADHSERERVRAELAQETSRPAAKASRRRKT